MFEFFQAWLVVVGIAVAVFGAVLAVLSETRLFAPIHHLLDAPFWPDGPDPAARSFRAWSYGVSGGTMAGWGLTIAIVASQAFGGRAWWTWWSIASAVALWYVLDTGQSIRHRVVANVLINTALLVAVAIPLAGTVSEFR